MKQISLIAVFILSIIIMPCFASNKSSASVGKVNAYNSLLGIWSNQKTGFKKNNIILYESGRGIITTSTAVVYFSWNVQETGTLSLELFSKKPPEIAISYDLQNQIIMMERINNNQHHKEIYKKTRDAIAKDPIVVLMAEEKKRQIERRSRFEKGYDIRSEKDVQLTKLKQLYEIGASKNGDYGFAVYANQYPEFPFLRISRKDNAFKLIIQFGDAMDESLPIKLRNSSRYETKPRIDCPERIHISHKNEKNIKLLLKSNSIQYKSIQEQFNYFDGYKVGYRNLVIAKLTEHEIDKMLPKILSLIADEHGMLNVRISNKKQKTPNKENRH